MEVAGELLEEEPMAANAEKVCGALLLPFRPPLVLVGGTYLVLLDIEIVPVPDSAFIGVPELV